LSGSERLAARLGRLLRSAQAEHRLPSVSAAAIRGKDVVWARAAGLADVESGRVATPNTQYRIGSITKSFTAAAVLQLRDAGRLSLDDPLDRHLPGTPHGSLTVRTMLSHLSGLQREPPGEIWESMRDHSREGLLAALADAELLFSPGEQWHYSNLAYSLLGELVARLSGLEWIDYVRERLFAPAGLERTTFAPVEPAARGYFVEPYTDVVRREHDVELDSSAPIGQLWSTAPDLCRWAAFLADPDPSALRPESAREMRAFQGMIDQESWTIGYGLGLMLYRHGDRVLFGHDGGMPGFLARLAYSEKEQVGAVALVASSAGAVYGPLALDLAAAAADEWPADPDVWKPGEEPPPDIAGVLGRWWTEGSEFVFSWRGGKLEARSAAATAKAPPATFEQLGPDLFRTASGRERGEPLRVVRDGSGEVVKLYWATYPCTRTPELFGP
jgi:CubicO group peptidase (beta-lactamase class C family)